MAELLHLEPEGIGDVVVLRRGENVASDGELIGALHIERAADGAFLAIVGVARADLSAEVGRLAGADEVRKLRDAVHLRHAARLFLGNEDDVAVHVSALCGLHLHVVASRAGE